MKTTKKLSRIQLIILISVLSLVAVLGISGISYAIWTRTDTAQKELDVPKEEFNASEKYIVFRGLDEQGEFSDVSGKEIFSYAAVGYDNGLVAEVVIPAVHNGKAVTKICVGETEEFYKYRFSGNPIITSITVPESVTEISAGACADMLLLETVKLIGESRSEVNIGDYAFANCRNLKQLETQRQIIGNENLYLIGTSALTSNHQ